ncbi:MAG TPA: Gfo/Idh/MocA family oxidoreductase [Actinoplanes sp.]|nr:Gfo/Idh/MocA family oxidoreductase [Actinoplanes sp.]
MNAVIIGCGVIASRWLRTLSADPRIRVVAVVDPDLARARVLAASYGVARAAATLTEAASAAAVQVAVNLTPPAAHTAVTRHALRAGLHVLTEKPLALTLADAVDLVTTARTSGRVLAVMHNRVLDPQFQPVVAACAGRSGPLAVTADVLVGLADPGFRSTQSYPVTTDLAVHAFDQIQVLISAAPVQVFCTETALPFIGAHASLATMTITFADGSVFGYRGGFTGPGLTTSATGTWQVHGTPLDPPVSTPDATPGYQRCITAMIDMLHTGPAAAAWPVTALRSIALLDAARRSAATGRPVTVAAVPHQPPTPTSSRRP